MKDIFAVLIGLAIICGTCYISIKIMKFSVSILIKAFGKVAPLVGGVLPAVVTYAITQALFGTGTSYPTLNGFVTALIIGLFIKKQDVDVGS
ncbi:hypothetical protein [Azospirillum argentinense]